ncbi:MAG: methyltransferase domain-containing protein [Candidatus Lernaella stagnicola]|nr:methyltransferase domain-containing protein [Candidatus Lernaella stagnicola]
MNELLETIDKLPVGARYVLYGAGQYTRRRLAAADLVEFETRDRRCVGFADDNAVAQSPWPGKPLAPLREAAAWDFTHLVIATDSFQEQLLYNVTQAQQAGELAPTVEIARVPAIRDEDLFRHWTATHKPWMTQRGLDQIADMAHRILGRDKFEAILDFGCGEHFPFASMAAARGMRAAAVDTIALVKDPRWMSDRHRWWLAAAAELLGQPVPVEQVEAMQYDGRQLPFADGVFDLIVSNSVLEHVSDMSGVLAELHRVTAPGGCAWHSVHYWTSINGFHPADAGYYADPVELPPGDEPWAHLLDDAAPPQDLNGWREADFRRALAEHFEILHLLRVELGAEQWTPEIGAKLAARGYHRDEVVIMVGQFFVRKIS